MENRKVIQKVFCVIILLTTFIFVLPAKVSADENTSFNVNVQESLSVSITTPTTWASGNIDTFLRNKVSISVSSNNSAGFTASMTTKTMDTSLTNTSRSSYSIPTLSSSSVRASFPANYWGYSLDDDDSNNGSGSSLSTYRAMVGSNSTPITILSSNVAATSSKDFYFGAKANVAQASGTYVGTVVISVVSGVINNSNPITPVDPVTPGEDQVAIYDSGANRTYYTYSTTDSGTSTTTTQISSGDNRSAYVGYTPPQGATHNKLNTNATLITGLGIATAIAATSGFFFLAAVRREEDEE